MASEKRFDPRPRGKYIHPINAYSLTNVNVGGKASTRLVNLRGDTLSKRLSILDLPLYIDRLLGSALMNRLLLIRAPTRPTYYRTL